MNLIAAATPDPEPDPTEDLYYEYDEPNEVESDPNIKWSDYLFGVNGKQAS